MESISFDRMADRYDETRGGMDRASNVVDGIEPHLRDGAVLEVGVGTGAVSAALRERGRTSVGVDLSEPMLRKAFERVGPVLAIGDAHHLPISTGSCANVVFVWVLHLVGDAAASLGEAGRVLTDGGRVFAIGNTTRDATDDIEPIVAAQHAALTKGRPRTDDLPPIAAGVGLELIERATSPPRSFSESPLDAAAAIERRTFSSLWDVDDATWQAVVQPAIDALRALPEPDRPRVRRAQQDVLVFAPT